MEPHAPVEEEREPHVVHARAVARPLDLRNQVRYLLEAVADLDSHELVGLEAIGHGCEGAAGQRLSGLQVAGSLPGLARRRHSQTKKLCDRPFFPKWIVGSSPSRIKFCTCVRNASFTDQLSLAAATGP